MKTFTEYLNEGRGFELGGKKYSSGFGRYTCDGKSISKEEYMKASAQYKGGKASSKSIKSVSSGDAKTTEEPKHEYYTPSSEEIKTRTEKPKVIHKNGSYEARIPVNPKFNRGSGSKSVKFMYKDYINDWYKEFVSDMKESRSRLGGEGTPTTGEHGKQMFKFWFKHGPAQDLENILDTSITTDNERERIFNGLLTAVFDHIDDNFEKISK